MTCVEQQGRSPGIAAATTMHSAVRNRVGTGGALKWSPKRKRRFTVRSWRALRHLGVIRVANDQSEMCCASTPAGMLPAPRTRIPRLRFGRGS
jgi:hypothetical protein